MICGIIVDLHDFLQIGGCAGIRVGSNMLLTGGGKYQQSWVPYHRDWRRPSTPG